MVTKLRLRKRRINKQKRRKDKKKKKKKKKKKESKIWRVSKEGGREIGKIQEIRYNNSHW